MKLTNLAKVVEGENHMAKFFNQPEIDVNNLSVEDAKQLWQKLECNLSPENLHCDGERSASEAKRYYKLSFW